MTITKEAQDLINAAVKAGMRAQKKEAAKGNCDTPFIRTRRRLEAYQLIKARIAMKLEEIQELERVGIHGHSKDIVRMSGGGARVSDEDKEAALIAEKNREVASDRRELSAIDKALTFIEEDEYYPVIYGTYIEGRGDEDVERSCNCAHNTAWRNRNRLIEKISIILYGAAAVN